MLNGIIGNIAKYVLKGISNTPSIHYVEESLKVNAVRQNYTISKVIF